MSNNLPNNESVSDAAIGQNATTGAIVLRRAPRRPEDWKRLDLEYKKIDLARSSVDRAPAGLQRIEYWTGFQALSWHQWRCREKLDGCNELNVHLLDWYGSRGRERSDHALIAAHQHGLVDVYDKVTGAKIPVERELGAWSEVRFRAQDLINLWPASFLEPLELPPPLASFTAEPDKQRYIVVSLFDLFSEGDLEAYKAQLAVGASLKNKSAIQNELERQKGAGLSAANKDGKWVQAIAAQIKRCINIQRAHKVAESLFPKGYPVPFEMPDVREKLTSSKLLPKGAVDLFMKRLSIALNAELE